MNENVNTYRVLKKLSGELAYAEPGTKFVSKILYDRGYGIVDLMDNGFIEIVPLVFDFEKEVVGNNQHSVLSICPECGSRGINFPLDTQCGNCGYHKTITYYSAEDVDNLLKRKQNQ